MRICLFTPLFLPDVGGAELAADALARSFTDKGHQVTVLALGKEQALDVPYQVRWARKPKAFRLFPERVGKALRRLHQREPYDIVLCNYTHPVGYAAVHAGRKTHVPVVIGSQGGDLYYSSKHRELPHLWKRTVRALNEAAGLVAISPHMEALMREIADDPPEIARIPNGVNIEEMTATSDRPADFNDPRPFMLCLGNVGPMKGFDHAIEAYAKAKDDLDGAILLVVGDGPMDKAVRDLSKKLELGGRVMFMGRRTGNDKRWFLKNCLFGVMPSIEEGLPLVGLEFMANRKALLCTTNPSFDELVTTGENGVRVPPRDVDAIAAAMVELHRADTASMGAVSFERVGDFEWDKVADRYLTLFESILAKGTSDWEKG